MNRELLERILSENLKRLTDLETAKELRGSSQNENAVLQLSSAALFLLADKLFSAENYHFRAEQIIASLYSGKEGSPFYLREKTHHRKPRFDDAAWIVWSSLIIASECPGLDQKYRIREQTEKYLNELLGAFEKTFMNYTESAPGHWTHPDDEWEGFPDLPHHGSSCCLAFCAAEKHASPNPRYQQYIQQYHEFLAAMISAVAPEEVPYAVLSTVVAAKTFPAQHHYRVLADAFGERFMNNIHAKAHEKNLSPDVTLPALQAFAALTELPEHQDLYKTYLFSNLYEKNDRHQETFALKSVIMMSFTLAMELANRSILDM